MTEENAKNTSLAKARNARSDEFYTQLTDIEKEMKHYRHHFKNKIIFLNCDDPEHSNFWRYFYLNFDFLGLKRLISTHYDDSESTYRLDAFKKSNGTVTIEKTSLMQNGDFRSPESIAILNECDIVVTNPPFSLFREYIELLIGSGKKFIVIGNQNSFTYKDVFTYLKNGDMWVGVNYGNMAFKVPNTPEYYREGKRYWVDEEGNAWRSLGTICWYTNLDYPQRHEDLILWKKYSPEEYEKYDNYDVINVNKVKDIPVDYAGVMGVPITFLNNFNPNQFELLGLANSARWIDYEVFTLIDGKKIYNRVIIRNRRIQHEN